jgi:hypothetical protein
VNGGVVILVLLGGLAWWRISLWRHPDRTCHVCSGNGETFGHFLGVVRGPCRRCGGSGKVARGKSRSPAPKP